MLLAERPGWRLCPILRHLENKADLVLLILLHPPRRLYVVSTIAEFNVLVSRDATKPESLPLILKWCFQGPCFSLWPPNTHTVAGIQVCLSHVFGNRDGAVLPEWEEVAFLMPMAWDLDPKDGGLHLMDFS